LIPLLLKKSFFDFWENLVPGLFINVIQFLLIGGAGLLVFLAPGYWLLWLLIFAGVQFFSLVLSYSHARRMRGRAKSEVPSLIRTLPGFLRIAFTHSTLLIGAAASLTLYLTPEPSLSWVLGILAFWLLMVWFLILWIFPGVVLLGETQPLRKSLTYVLSDLPRLLLLGLIALPLSLSSVIILPGQAWVVSMGMNIARFYALRETARLSGGAADWPSLLKEVKAEVSGRTLRSVIFPWK
jgi:hypothetical protein